MRGRIFLILLSFLANNLQAYASAEINSQTKEPIKESSTPKNLKKGAPFFLSVVSPLSYTNLPIFPRADVGSIGLQYKKFYVGAQVDSFNLLQPALDKIKQINELRGAHLTSGGIRIGGFLNTKTLIYVKAGFVNKTKRHEYNTDKISTFSTIRPKTSFAPGLGFEWQLPKKLSVAGEIRTAFERRSTLSSSKRRPNGTILFNVRYKLGSDKSE